MSKRHGAATSSPASAVSWVPGASRNIWKPNRSSSISTKPRSAGIRNQDGGFVVAGKKEHTNENDSDSPRNTGTQVARIDAAPLSPSPARALSPDPPLS